MPKTASWPPVPNHHTQRLFGPQPNQSSGICSSISDSLLYMGHNEGVCTQQDVSHSPGCSKPPSCIRRPLSATMGLISPADSSLVSRLGAQQLLARRQHVSKKHTLGLSTSKLKAALVLLLSRTDNPFGGPPAQNSAEKALKLPVTMSFPHWSCCGWDFEHSKVPAAKGRSKGLGGITPNPRAQVFLFSGMRVHHKEAERPAIHSHYGCVTEEDLNSPEMWHPRMQGQKEGDVGMLLMEEGQQRQEVGQARWEVMSSMRPGQRTRSAQSNASPQPAHSNLALSIQVAKMHSNCLQGFILCQQSEETQRSNFKDRHRVLRQEYVLTAPWTVYMSI